MKRFLCLSILLISLSIAYAQEGASYKGIKRVMEKNYDVIQKYGRNILMLKTRAVGIYDSEGLIIEKTLYKGNMTFLGREFKNYNADQEEIIKQNYMNLLSYRSMKTKANDSGEYTEIEYDSKGKLLTKTNFRLFPADQSIWELEYGQLGWVQRYMKLDRDTVKVVGKTVFNYYDDPIEQVIYIYNDHNLLQTTIHKSLSDTLIHKIDYRYSDKANLIEENHSDYTDSVYLTIRYYYDDQSRMIQKSEFLWDQRFGDIPKLKKQSDYSYL